MNVDEHAHEEKGNTQKAQKFTRMTAWIISIFDVIETLNISIPEAENNSQEP